MERDTTYFGIKEIYLDRQRDEVGERFQFVVNQQPIYIKGANYLPHDRRFGGGGRSLEDIFREDILPSTSICYVCGAVVFMRRRSFTA